jgi:hypothetical protein
VFPILQNSTSSLLVLQASGHCALSGGSTIDLFRRDAGIGPFYLWFSALPAFPALSFPHCLSASPLAAIVGRITCCLVLQHGKSPRSNLADRRLRGAFACLLLAFPNTGDINLIIIDLLILYRFIQHCLPILLPFVPMALLSLR